MKFKEGDIVRVLPLPRYSYGTDSDATAWEGTVTTIKKIVTHEIQVDAIPFNSPNNKKRRRVLSTYCFREDELEFAKEYYLEQFSQQL